jgi:MFS family permease
VSDKTADKQAVPSKYTRRALLAMTALCVAVFVAALDQTMVYTLMKDLMYSLGIDVEHIGQAGWIITGYLLGYTVAMPLFGALADVRGRRLMTIVALLLFMVGSALCIFVRHFEWFVVARVVQAAGGGALVPIAMAAAADMFPLRRRALALGIVGGAAEAGGVLGPLYGVGLAAIPWGTSNLWWPLIFIVNIPLCLVLIVVCWRVLRGDLRHPEYSAPLDHPNDKTDAATHAQLGSKVRWWQRGGVDYVGAALMALALASVTVGLGTGSQTLDGASTDTVSPVNWPWLAVSALAFVLFVMYERRQERPLVQLEFFKKPAFAAANIAFFLVGVALIIGMAGISLFAQTVFGLSQWEAGLLLVQLTLPIPIGAVLGGWLADRIGCKITAVLGFLAAAAGYLLVSRWPVDPSFWTKVISLVVAGLGLGFVIGPVGTSVTSSVGPKSMATGSALVTVSRMVGMAVGLAAISSWGVRRVNALSYTYMLAHKGKAAINDPEIAAALDAAQKHATSQTFSAFFLIAAIVLALAVIPSLFFYNHRPEGSSRLPFLPH